MWSSNFNKKMILNIFLLIFLKSLFYFLLIILSFKANYFRSISARVFLNYALSLIISNFIILIFYENYKLEYVILSEIILLLIIIILHIYIPLLIDRSFSISILLILFNKDIQKSELSIFFEENFNKFIDRRVDYLLLNKFIVLHNDSYTLTKKGKFISYIYNLFKKLFNINNNSIL